MADPYSKFMNFYDLLIEPVVGGTRKAGMKLHPLPAGSTVLDIGCGTGTQLALYQKAGCRVFGVEKSPSMLQAAKQKLGSSAELFQEDATCMHFPDEMFDLVVMELSLHEMYPETRKSVLVECVRVLKKDGKILVVEFNVDKFSGFIGWFRHLGVSIVEHSAGTVHFTNFRNFTKIRGLKGVIQDEPLVIEKYVESHSGIFAAYLLKTVGFS